MNEFDYVWIDEYINVRTLAAFLDWKVQRQPPSLLTSFWY